MRLVGAGFTPPFVAADAKDSSLLVQVREPPCPPAVIG